MLNPAVTRQIIEADNERLYVWPNLGKLIDRNGYVVYISSEIWIVFDHSETKQVNWNNVHLPVDLKDAFKAYVAHIIESYAAGYAITVFNHTKYVLSLIPNLSSIHDLTYKAMESVLCEMRKAPDGLWKYGHARRFYQWSCGRQIPGFSNDVAKRLADFFVPHNPTGEAVSNRDVTRGPLTEEEHWLIRKAFKNYTGTAQERAAIGLNLEVAPRPTQSVLLEEGDFKITISPDGKHKFYSVNVPRLKQRTVGGYEKRRRRISPELGETIERLIEENHAIYGDRGPCMPIFCRHKQVIDKQIIESGATSRSIAMSASLFKVMVREYTSKYGIISPRTGDKLNLFTYRFRYTLGTRLAAQGTPAQIIADMLDHSDTSSVMIYIKSASGMVERLNAALGANDEYMGVINRFAGVIISRTGREDSRTIIQGRTHTLKKLGGIGVCGATFLCKLFPPLSCYACEHFNAWVDGPHEEMLQEVESFVGELAGRMRNPSDRIPRQLREVIICIKAVLLKIKERKQGRINGNE